MDSIRSLAPAASAIVRIWVAFEVTTTSLSHDITVAQTVRQGARAHPFGTQVEVDLAMTAAAAAAWVSGREA